MVHPLHEQVVVITGASSGIGRETALKFSQAGARVVLAARNHSALEDLATQINNQGGQVLVVPTDVTAWEDVDQLAQEAVAVFGRIDTWVNDAAVSVYGLVEETTVEEFEKIIQTNLLGTIYGVKAVLPHMRRQGYGTIINVGSVVSERAVPLQSGYVATKFGVRGFTDALRLEMQREKANINVTLILPASINTPFFEHARSHMENEPMPIPPVYEPSLVADAIVHAAHHHKRNIYVGGASKMFTLMERISPSLTDRMMMVGNWIFKLQQAPQPNDMRDTFDHPGFNYGRSRGEFAHLTKPSMYTRLIEFAPRWTRLALPALLLGSLFLVKRRQES
jgi:short-subunit dehydrogenase